MEMQKKSSFRTIRCIPLFPQFKLILCSLSSSQNCHLLIRRLLLCCICLFFSSLHCLFASELSVPIIPFVIFNLYYPFNNISVRCVRVNRRNRRGQRKPFSHSSPKKYIQMYRVHHYTESISQILWP